MASKKKSYDEPSYVDDDDAPRVLNVDAMDLGTFIEKASGGEYKAPVHLGPYFAAMQSLHGGNLRLCISCPPQHGKTTLAVYAIVWTLLRNPKLKFAYASHGQNFSNEQSRIMRELFVMCGGSISKDFNTVAQWKTGSGGGLIACSPESSLNGRRVDVAVFDDLLKNHIEAESEVTRESIRRWIDTTASQRLWVGGSVVCIGTRWHPEDPSGYLLSKGYADINLPAVTELADGTEIALWPDVKPIAWLDNLRLPSGTDYVGDHAWESSYQGNPQPREGAVFGPPREYADLPPGASIVAIGLDLATSASANADHTAIVVLAYLSGTFYVHDVRRLQQSTLDVEAALNKCALDYPDVRMVSYVSGPERGLLNLFFARGLRIERLPARTSKWSRAQRCSIAWRQGRVLVRSHQPWTKVFCREVEYFTGNEGQCDDQVDALVSGFDLIEIAAPVGWAGAGFAFGKAAY